MPRMVAAEVYGSIGTALAERADALPDMPKTHDTVAVSIGATRGTYQALDIVRRSGGTAVQIGNDDIVRWQQRLASGDGLYVEPTSAGTRVAVEKLRKAGTLGEKDAVAVLLTAGGLKDPEVTARAQEPLLVVPADPDAAVRTLRAEGLFPTR